MVMRMMLFYGEIAGCQGYQKVDRFTKQEGTTAPHRSKHERTTALEAQCTKHYTKTHSAKNMQ